MNENTWLKVRNLREGNLVGVEPLTSSEIASLRTMAAAYVAARTTQLRQVVWFDTWHAAVIVATGIALFACAFALYTPSDVLLPPWAATATLFTVCVLGCALIMLRFLRELFVRPIPAPLQAIEADELYGGWVNDLAPHDYVALDTLAAGSPERAYAATVLNSGRDLTVLERSALLTAKHRADQKTERDHATSAGQHVRRALASGL